MRMKAQTGKQNLITTQATGINAPFHTHPNKFYYFLTLNENHLVAKKKKSVLLSGAGVCF